MTIKESVDKLIRKHGTRDPVKIATMMGIFIQFRNLKGILGYYQTYRRIHVIHVAIGLPETLIAFIVAHELAHRILHPNVNVPFLRTNTFHSIDRIERQANQFAVDLLIPDELLVEGMTLFEAAAACGVPEEVAHLKTMPRRRT